jgi:opacity protein-like surface antigen
VAVAWLAAARGASAAAGEEEWQVSVRAGVGALDVDGRSPFGGAFGVDVEYGFTDAWAARLSATVGFNPVDAQKMDMEKNIPALPGGTVRTTAAVVGVTYTFDVLRLVPYIETGIGVLNFAGAVTKPTTTLSAELGLGADYLVTKRWAVGGILQYQFTPIELFGSAMDFGGTSYDFVLSVRLSRLF